MADEAYGTSHNYTYAQEHQEDVILWITPKNFCMYNKAGNKISLSTIIQNFNPLSREGSDFIMFVLKKQGIISIHTPAKGVTTGI